MRPYSDKQNVQAKSYYSDRFFKAPQVPRDKVSSDKVFNEDLKSVKEKFKVSESYIEKGQLVLIIEPTDIKALMKHLKEQLSYDFMCEMSAVDFLAQSDQFEIFYQMLSIKKKKRLRVKYKINNGDAVESIVSVFNSANWAEREMYDMFGIYVNNHPYLKRLIMPDDWTGYPLLKTYPLIGDEAAQWYEIDTIFGKEHREVVGPEIRDTKRVDPKDTTQFSRVGAEVPYGAKPTNEKTNFSEFQEDGGVPFITRFTKDRQKTLKSRK
ncbi:MAG: NADH-quinone oxidoreductase subunit C [Epsilonproteobacteria bacterium]|nr:NADH-quinone oxidoreductase subunit C [Campylobacterota bacterium]